MKDYFYSLEYALEEYENEKRLMIYRSVNSHIYLYLTIDDFGYGNKKWLAAYGTDIFDETDAIDISKLDKYSVIRRIEYRESGEKEYVPAPAYKALFNLINHLGKNAIERIKDDLYRSIPERLKFDDCFKFMDIVMNKDIKDCNPSAIDILKNGINAFCNYISYLKKSDYINRDFDLYNLMRPFRILHYNLNMNDYYVNLERKYEMYTSHSENPSKFDCYDLVMDLASGEYILKIPEYNSLYEFSYLDNKNYVQVALVETSNLFKNIKKENLKYFDELINYLKELSKASKKAQCCKVLEYLDFTEPSREYEDLSEMECNKLNRIKDLYNCLKDKKPSHLCYTECEDFINNLSIILYSSSNKVKELIKKSKEEDKKCLDELNNYLKMFDIE